MKKLELGQGYDELGDWLADRFDDPNDALLWVISFVSFVLAREETSGKTSYQAVQKWLKSINPFIWHWFTKFRNALIAAERKSK